MDVLGLPLPLRILTMPKPTPLLADRLFRMLVIRQNPPLFAVLLAIIMRVVLRGCQGPRRPRGPIAGHVTP